MAIHDAFKNFGLLAAVILACGLLYIVKKWPQGRDKTFSQHIASNKQGISFYIALFSLVLPLMLAFFLGWFIPEFNLPGWFTLAIVVAAILQYLCTLIPETGGRKTQYHRALAFLSADLLLIPIFILVLTNTINLIGRVFAAFVFIVMLSIVSVLILNKGEHKNILIMQLAYFALFFAAVLVITYFS